jgi:AcrR family transcriptional regulator
LEAATGVFRSEGFRAVGVDRLMAEAGVSRMTLYNNFGSKDDLIVAVLRRCDESTRAALRKRVQSAGRPGEALVEAVAFFAEAAGGGSGRGCLFVNAAAEYSDVSCAVRRAAAEHKRLVREYLVSLCESAGVGDPEGVAGRLAVVIEGVLAGSAAGCGGTEGGGGGVAETAELCDRAIETARLVVRDAGVL